MKKALIFTLALSLLAVCAQAQSWVKKDKEAEKTKGWIDNFEQAKKESETFKQPIFAFFTGSDWCGWCMKLKKEALDTKTFEKFAADNLILFEADFPNAKKLSDKVKKQNEALSTTYGIKGFPTVLLLDAEGKSLGKTGYKEGGDEAYVKHLKELLNQAGVKTVDKPEEAKPLSPFEKMKAEKAAKEAPAAEKK
ncbi:MAG: thioredoxin family protein [Verrucomicrobiota bacterium]|nr:thioredoxin family protein [Verrucomicrobiota bacterium]